MARGSKTAAAHAKCRALWLSPGGILAALCQLESKAAVSHHRRAAVQDRPVAPCLPVHAVLDLSCTEQTLLVLLHLKPFGSYKRCCWVSG